MFSLSHFHSLDLLTRKVVTKDAARSVFDRSKPYSAHEAASSAFPGRSGLQLSSVGGPHITFIEEAEWAVGTLCLHMSVGDSQTAKMFKEFARVAGWRFHGPREEYLIQRPALALICPGDCMNPR